MIRFCSLILLVLACTALPVQGDWMWRSTGVLTAPEGSVPASTGARTEASPLVLPSKEPAWSGLKEDADPGPLPAAVADKLRTVEELNRAAEAYRHGKYGNAAGVCTSFIKETPTHAAGPYAQFLWAASEFQQGNLLRSYDLLDDLNTKFPASELTPYTARWQLAIASRFLLGYRETFLGMKIRGTPDDAQRILERMLERYPYGQLTDRLLVRLGDRYRSVGDYNQAILYYDRVLRDFLRSPLAVDAEFSRLECLILDTTDAHHDVSGLREANDGLRLFIEQHPRDTRAPKARAYLDTIHAMLAEHTFLIAEFYAIQHRWQASRRYFQQVTDQFSDTPWAPRARRRLEQIRPPELVVPYGEQQR
jgi:outer membrane assembly lipoprotein YfiO